MGILGRSIQLSEGRIVFVGTDMEAPGMNYLAFRNANGDDNKFVLSDEAVAALKELLSDPLAGMPLKDFPHKMVWKCVVNYEGKLPE